MKIGSLFIRKSAHDVDMTEGSIVRHLIAFAVPLLVGNLFQQFYNMVDTWVVGNYVSNEAFSAVGTVGPIVNTLIGFFMGLASGAGVVISQYFGAKREDEVKRTVHTATLMTLALAVLFTVVGILMIPAMLDLIRMPAEAREPASQYLRIYFGGIITLMLYNIGAGILRAVGDSKRPFYYLVVCALMNIVLDLLFVLRFDMGVAGVALATVLSQGVSSVLVFLHLFRAESCIRLSLRDMKPDFGILAQIIRVGIPAALQMAITSFSNVFVQSYINYFGTNCMSGWTAYNKVDQLMYLPMQSIALASTTFVGQNLGKGDAIRAKKGSNIALTLAEVSTVIIMIPILIFAPVIVAFFNSKPEVVEFGTLFLRRLSPFYVLCCINQIYSGALRGAGNTRAPMLIMLGSFVLFRQIYLYVMANFISNTILPISLSYPAGWLVCSAITFAYYRRVRLERTRIVRDD